MNRKEYLFLIRDKLGYDWRRYVQSEVRWRRRKRGLTQKALGVLVGCPPQYISLLESAGDCPVKTLVAILKELQILNIGTP